MKTPTIEELEAVKKRLGMLLSKQDEDVVRAALTQAIAIEKGESEPPRVDVGEALDFLVSMAKDQLEHPQHGNTERAAAVIRAALKQPAQAQGVDATKTTQEERG